MRQPGDRFRWWWLSLLGLAIACEAASLEGKPCPCLPGYVCCKAENVCLPVDRPDQVCVDLGAWSPATTPVPPRVSLEDVTVYAFSQVDTNGPADQPFGDESLLALQPDMVIRGWAQWGRFGGDTVDYQFSYVDRCHQANIRYFTGGLTATVLLDSQLGSTDDSLDPRDLTARNARNHVLLREDEYKNKLYRATLANPEVRQELIRIGKLQIDGGVDGLHFQELNAGYQGARPTGTDGAVVADGNEGFDKFHLADFNAYLLAQNPPGTNFDAWYGMAADNRLRHDIRAGDLARNFNYWEYLARNGWADTPLTDVNPLASAWGRTTVNRPRPGALTFVDSAEPYRYWKDIVDTLRAYARARHQREIVMTAQGTYPFVDFQSVGLDDFNTDGPDGKPVQYLPVTADGKHLDGRQSLQAPFRNLKTRSEAFAPGAPVVLFLDGRWKTYGDFPDPRDRSDFWRLYAAEAYANGLFFAFHLRSSVGPNAEPTAEQLGLMPLFHRLAGFYRGHAAYYHGVVASSATARIEAPARAVAVGDDLDAATGPAMLAVSDQLGGDVARPLAHRLVHIVNHAYEPGVGILTRSNVMVSFDSPNRPAVVTLASPDWELDLADVPFAFDAGQVTLALPALQAYVVIRASY